MIEKQDYIVPFAPAALQDVDIVRLRFVLDFISHCTLQPSDFLGLGRILKGSGRQFVGSSDNFTLSQWEALFLPPLSTDPVSLRKHQKPTPAFVLNIPVFEQKVFSAGDQLDLEVLFIGKGISLIHVFLLSLVHLGRLGLVAGEGQYDVREVFSISCESDTRVWRQGDPVKSLPCQVSPLRVWR